MKLAWKTQDQEDQENLKKHTLYDRVQNENIRLQREMQDLGRWVRQRRRFWNKYVKRMDDIRRKIE